MGVRRCQNGSHMLRRTGLPGPPDTMLVLPCTQVFTEKIPRSLLAPWHLPCGSLSRVLSSVLMARSSYKSGCANSILSSSLHVVHPVFIIPCSSSCVHHPMFIIPCSSSHVHHPMSSERGSSIQCSMPSVSSECPCAVRWGQYRLGLGLGLAHLARGLGGGHEGREGKYA